MTNRARTAKIITCNNMRSFLYANGTPGDLEIAINPEEMQSWEEIIRAVNLLPELLEYVKHYHQFLKADGHTDKSSCCKLSKVIARAEKVLGNPPPK